MNTEFECGRQRINDAQLHLATARQAKSTVKPTQPCDRRARPSIH
jgi:hypothetical protein